MLSLFLFLSHRFCLLSFLFCDKVTVISIHYFLWDAAFHLFNSSGIYVFAIYWFFLHLTLYLFESSVEVQCEEWATDTVSLRWSYVRFKSGCLDFSTLTSRGVSASSVLKIRSSSSSRNSSTIFNSSSLYIVSNALDMSIPVIKMVLPCIWDLAAIHLWAHTTSVVLLDFLYALCDWNRCLLILSYVLSMNIFDSIFRITSSKLTGRRFFTGPSVFFGFWSGSRIPVPNLILISFLSYIPFIIYTLLFQ